MSQVLEYGAATLSPERQIIYLCPLGALGPAPSAAKPAATAAAQSDADAYSSLPTVDTLVECVQLWFGLPVKLLPGISQEEALKFEHRRHQGHLQLKTGPIHDYLKSIKPKDAFVIVAFTMYASLLVMKFLR